MELPVLARAGTGLKAIEAHLFSLGSRYVDTAFFSFGLLFLFILFILSADRHFSY